MITLKIKDKEYKIEYGFEATIRTKIISKVAKLQNDDNTDKKKKIGLTDIIDKMEDIISILPEMLLVGLQKNHEEFKFDYDNDEAKKSKIGEMYGLIEDYTDGEHDVYDLFGELQEEMLKNGFLKKMFHQMMEAMTANKQEKQTIQKKMNGRLFLMEHFHIT